MAAEATRRRMLVIGLVVALVGVAATGLMVAFRHDPAVIEGRDAARGERLRATFAIEVDDSAVADAHATLRVTNSADESAWYAAVPCSGPSEPWIAPEGARAPGAVENHAPLRARLVAAAATARSVTLYPEGDAEVGCDLDEGAVEIPAGETVTVAYVAQDPIDRSLALHAVATVNEVTRTGRPLGRLRLVIPIAADPDADGLPVEQAVDVFLAYPDVADFVGASGDAGMLTQVTRQGDGWRISLSSSVGDISGEVLDGITVTSVTYSG